MNRRKVLVAGVAGSAGAAGLGAAWWANRAAPATASADLWSMQFKQPDGGGLRLSEFRGRPLLLNFWATWCPPCVREMPLLDRFYREQPALGLRVVGLAVDNLTPVVDFLKQRPVSFPIGLAGLEGVELARALGNRTGALPFSILFNRQGSASDRKLGTLTVEDLLRWVKSAG
jgi:thiol-disulfide isomerase/thioredoxin